jgi:hypothetical protein
MAGQDSWTIIEVVELRQRRWSAAAPTTPSV